MEEKMRCLSRILFPPFVLEAFTTINARLYKFCLLLALLAFVPTGLLAQLNNKTSRGSITPARPDVKHLKVRAKLNTGNEAKKDERFYYTLALELHTGEEIRIRYKSKNYIPMLVIDDSADGHVEIQPDRENTGASLHKIYTFYTAIRSGLHYILFTSEQPEQKGNFSADIFRKLP